MRMYSTSFIFSNFGLFLCDAASNSHQCTCTLLMVKILLCRLQARNLKAKEERELD